MHVPFPILAILCLLAAIPVTVAAAFAHQELARRGLTLLGTREQYLDGGVRMVRFCILYVPVVTLRRWHSTMLTD